MILKCLDKLKEFNEIDYSIALAQDIEEAKLEYQKLCGWADYLANNDNSELTAIEIKEILEFLDEVGYYD